MNKVLVYIVGMALVVSGIAVSAAGIAQIANANGINVHTARPVNSVHSDWKKLGSQPTVQVFVNLPVHDAPANTYDKANVPLSYKVTWAVCENKPSAVRVMVRYDVNGGLHSNFEGNSNTQWKTISNQVFSEVNCDKGDRCFTTRSYNLGSGINMSDVQGNHTTLQVIAKWSWSQIPSDALPTSSNGDNAIVNVWLHWAQPIATPTPTPVIPTPTPTPSVSPTPTPTPAITPTPTPSITPTPTATPTVVPTPTPTIVSTCVDGNGNVIVIANGSTQNCNVNTNTQTVSLNVNNSSNNSSSNDSKSESNGNVNKITIVKKAAPKVAGTTVHAVSPAATVAVPVSAKTGAEDVVTLLFSTLFGGSGMAYIVRKTLLG